MRKISFLWLSLLFSGIFLINSCQNEEIGIEEPSIWFGNGQGFIYKDTTLNTLDTLRT